MKKTPTKTLFFLIPILFVIELGAQNLVPNPGFETYSSCPFALAQLNLATGWYSPTGSSPDFYHVCGTYPASVPVNLPGIQDPLAGQGYAGIVTYHGFPLPDYREYIQTVLSEPLVAGFCYDLEMFISSAESWPMNGINHVGMYLSESPPGISPNGQINAVPQVYYNDVILDVNNWISLTGTYVASGGEQYLTIGNFDENGNFDIQPLPPPAGGTDAAYYYIENVKVELAQGGQQDMEATICEGECYEFEGQDYCAEGTYQISVQGGCFNTVNLTIYVDELAIADIELPEILDCNITETILDASGSSSGPGVSYQWTGPNNFASNQQNPTVFDPGTYTLIVSGTGLCSTEASIEVLEDIVYPDIVTEVSGALDCNNLVVTLTGSSSTQNVTFQWNGPGVDVNAPTALATQAGIYTLTITGPGGCTSSEDIMVEEDLEQPDISAEVLGVLDCNSPSVVLLGSSSTPNATFVWSGPGVNSNDLTALAEFPGDYTFVVIGPNGCISSQTVTVIEEITILDIEATVDGMLDCENTTVTLTGSSNSPNITYQWVGPGVFDDMPVVEVDEPGQYTFSIMDNFGCTAETSVIVVQNIEIPVIVINTPDTINCSTTSIDLDASGSSGNGSLDFEWQNENGDALGNAAVLNVTASGIYILMLTDIGNGCSGQSSVEVFGDTNQPEAIVSSNGNIDCNNVLVSLDGGSSSGNSLDFQWLDSSGNVISVDTAVDVSIAGVYSLLLTNTTSGCTSSASIEVESNIDLPTVVVANPDTLSCFINDAILDGNGSSEGINIFYEWQNPSGDSIFNELQFTISEPGVYTLIVFNNENGCSASSAVEILQNIETPVAVAGEDELITCDESTFTLDGSASSIGSGILIFQWTNSNNEIISISETVEVDLADVYTLTVIGENGCSASDEVEVMLDTNVPVADAGAGGTLNCEVSTITLGGSGSSIGNNITYQWLDENNQVVAITATTDVALPGTYTLIVTDILNNCSTSASIEIPQDIQSPTADAGNGAILNCLLTEITLDGSQSSSGPEFSYQWFNSNNVVISNEISVLTSQPDSYTLIVSNSENGCTALSTVVIGQNIDTPLADAGADGVLTCDLNEISLDGNGSSGNNLSFEWFNGSGISVGNQAVIQVSGPGIYTLIVTDTESNCTAQADAEVVPDDNLPTAIATADDILTCEIIEVTIDGSASTSVSGSIGFEWLDESGSIISTIDNTTVFAPGIYTLIVTDTENGCSISTTVEVEQDIEAPVADAGENQTLICGQTSLTLDAGGSSGQNLSFEWQDDNGTIIATTAATTVLSSGIYIVFVTNTENGCSDSDSVEVIPDFNLPTADAGAGATLTCDITEIQLDGSASSAGPNIEYAWQNSSGDVIATSQAVIISEPGIYTLFVLDTENNCISQDEVTVLENITPPTAFINTGSSTDLDCNNSSTVLDGTGSSPAGQLEFLWTTDDGNIDSGADTPNPEVNAPGTYILTVTNMDNGCTDTASIEILEDLETPVVFIDPPQILTCAVNEITLIGHCISAGNYSFYWSTSNGNIIFGQDTLLATVDQPGDFVIEVTNIENGCQSTATVTVEQDITPPTAIASVDDQFDCVTESVALDGSGSSVGAQFTYNWTGSGTIDNPSGLNPTVYEPGIYTILVTDLNNGCTQSADVLVGQDEDVPSAADIQVVEPACYGDPASIAVVSVEGGDSPYLYSIDGGESFNPSGFFNSLSPGTYNILIQDAKGCEYEDVVVIEPAIELVLELEREVILGLGDDYQIEALTNMPESETDTIIWSPSVGLSCFDCLDPIVSSILNEIMYTVTLIDTSGCSITAQILLRVDKTREVFIPNAFSPNDDGTNDKIMIFANAEKIKQVNTFRIFDRWGEIVFEANGFQPNDPDYGWDGIFNGEHLNPAVFVYFAEIEFIDGVTILYKGDVTLMR